MSSNNNNNNNKNSRKSLGMMNQHAGWFDRKKDALMVVASLIAAMAFQVGVNPPGGVWQEDYLVDAESKEVTNPHIAGESIFAEKYSVNFIEFYITKAVAFIASLSIVLLLTSGLPIRRRFFMWILMVITWIAITAIARCYVLVIGAVMPTYQYDIYTHGLVYSVYVWIGLMALVLIADTIRIVGKFVKLIRKAWMRMRTRRYARLTR